jgi:phage FluMu protein Com
MEGLEMSIEVACRCGKVLKAKDEHAGLKVKCPGCGAVVEVPKAQPDSAAIPDGVGIDDLKKGLEEDRLGSEREATLTDVWKVLNTIATSIGSSSSKRSSDAGQNREYKVITQKDKWFSGKFDPEKVEGVLNSYAKQGWVMKGIATASIPGFGGQREEIVIIMER